MRVLLPGLVALFSLACGSPEPPGVPPETSPETSRNAPEETAETAFIAGAEPLHSAEIFTDTSDLEVIFQRGMALYNESRFVDAARAFRQALRIRPDHLDAHYYAGKSLLESVPPEYAAAETEFLAVLETNPDHLDGLIALAQLYFFWARYEDAAGLLARALVLSPDHRGVLYSSGLIASRLGRYGEAVSFLERATQRDPRHLPSLLELGTALSHLSRHEEALAIYRRALELSPTDTRALLGAGTSLDRLGRSEEARAMLTRFKETQARLENLENDGTRVNVWIQAVEEAYKAGDRDAARTAAAGLIEEFPRWSRMHQYLGRVQAQWEDYEAAIKTFSDVLARQPDDLDANHSLLLLYRQVGDDTRARRQQIRYDELLRKAEAAPLR